MNGRHAVGKAETILHFKVQSQMILQANTVVHVDLAVTTQSCNYTMTQKLLYIPTDATATAGKLMF